MYAVSLARTPFALVMLAIDGGMGLPATIERECSTMYTFYGRPTALGALAKHFGLFNEHLQVELWHERARSESVDYSHLSNEELQEAIETLEEMQRRLRPPTN